MPFQWEFILYWNYMKKRVCASISENILIESSEITFFRIFALATVCSRTYKKAFVDACT